MSKNSEGYESGANWCTLSCLMFALRRLPATAWPLATRSLSTMAPKAACACGPVEACCNAVAAPAIADTTLLAAEATPAPSMVERVTEALRNGKQALETSLEDLMKQSIWLAVPKRKVNWRATTIVWLGVWVWMDRSRGSLP
jgi:hypothetical protein